MAFVEGNTYLNNKVEQIVQSVKVSKFFTVKKDISLPYVYPCDNYIDTILSNILVRKTLQHFVDKYCRDQIISITLSGQLVNENSYPHLNLILLNCFKTLNVTEFPDVYITNRLKGINALSVDMDNKPIILISPKAIMTLTDGELKFMIGHELGHILQKNLICHTIKGILDNLNNKSEILGTIVSDLIDIPLNQWCRCTEYTADRAGLICCSDIKYVYQLMNKLKVYTDKRIEPNLMELYKTHPLIEKRIRMLEVFSNSIVNI